MVPESVLYRRVIRPCSQTGTEDPEAVTLTKEANGYALWAEWADGSEEVKEFFRNKHAALEAAVLTAHYCLLATDDGDKYMEEVFEVVTPDMVSSLSLVGASQGVRRG